MTSDLTNLLDSAFMLHKQGKLVEAKVIYEKFINLYPDNLDAMNLYAQLLLQIGEFDSAISFFEKVYSATKLETIKYEIAKAHYMKGELNIALEILLSINDKGIDVYNLIANISLQFGKIEDAINANLEILKLNPNLYDITYNLSVLYANLEQLDNSLTYALDAYKLVQNDINLLFHIASLYDAMNKKSLMLEYLEKVLELNPNNEILLAKMGIEYTELKNPIKAVSCYERCLKINEFNYDALVNLAVLLIDIKKYDYAISLCNKALEVAPNNIRTYHSLFLIYKDMNEVELARKQAILMIDVAPDNHLGYGCLGDINFEYFDYNIALECYDVALKFAPTELTYLYNKGCCLNLLNRYDDALLIADDMLKIDKNSIKAMLLKTYVNLKCKKYSEAMETYPLMVRPDIKQIINGPRFSKKYVDKKADEYYKHHWDRQDISDKTLLLYNNDGYGDSIMFSRYVALLEKKCKNLIIEADKNLFRLYKSNFKNSHVILEKDFPFIGYDYTVSSMELLYSANLGLDNIPCSDGWLSVLVTDETKIDTDNNKLNVGVFWQGNKQILKNRFLSLSQLLPIFELENLKFFSLDITQKDEETSSLLKKYNVVDCSENISDFYDTASIVKQLDLVITIDSSIVHLAGALGVKTFLLLPNNTEWRWFNDVDTTPWYDSVKIFKQKYQSNWEEVILRIKKELQ